MVVIKILLIVLCRGEIAFGQFNLQWFFNPFNENLERTFNIDNHAKAFDERLGISSENGDIDVTLEDAQNQEPLRSKRGRSLSQRSSEPQLPPFRFRPFESLARNINFKSPSNVFCKNSM